jgi:MOSC domain-containing protein YiiM
VAELAALTTRVPQTGTVQRILLRPARREHPADVAEVMALAGRGLEGDRRAERVPRAAPSPRQVTLVQAEHLAVVGDLLDRGAPVDAAPLRRNLVVRGIPLLALKGLRFRIGEAVLEGTGPCHPCARMEEALGAGGYQAMRGHGGLTAVVVTGGRIRTGDEVAALGPSSDGLARGVVAQGDAS